MAAKIIDGKALAAGLRAEVAAGVRELMQAGGAAPGLATVLVGENPASETYLRMKRKASDELGITTLAHELPADIQQAELEALIDKLNADRRVHGILVQLPLPARLDEEAVLSRVDVNKDVDGFHPTNIGRLAQKGREPLFVPATPAGCLRLLKHAGAELQGAKAVVVGRSNIVGLPAALLLIKEDATVTIAHSKTRDLPAVCREAEVLIVAAGKPELVRGDWIKRGAYVIDVGTNRVEDSSRKRGYRIVGDVAFDEAVEVAGAITPVPGGVGPMTIAGLLQNTLKAAQLAST